MDQLWHLVRYVIHEQIADNFLDERNHADLLLHFLQ